MMAALLVLFERLDDRLAHPALPPSDTCDVLAITDRPHMAISVLGQWIALSTLENVLSHVLEHPDLPNLTLTTPNRVN